MPRDGLTAYRRQQLAVDASSIADVADTLARLINRLPLLAREAQDETTGDAMLALASDLRDAAHGPFSAMLAAHEAACDVEGLETIYTPDADVCLAIGLPATAALTKQQLQAAVDEIARRLAPARAS